VKIINLRFKIEVDKMIGVPLRDVRIVISGTAVFRFAAFPGGGLATVGHDPVSRSLVASGIWS
jgi:hypothetical protein